ncbi:hypothetical protein BDW59DRAFT_115458 [Aspergillus cavernicola]|uniref:Uncharacterized protein n=1 Tax=Aspergillus cavernicola TaxID=176166 RepID=A0ABR4IWE6_9EURO
MPWYYYLSDVTLKRIEAQVLNTFYNNHNPDVKWNSSKLLQMTRMATIFENQIDDWFKTLSPIIHFEEWDKSPPQELIYNLQARVLGLRSWLYRPFVCYAIHNHNHSHSEGEEENNLSQIQIDKFVQKCIECCFHIIQSKPTRHRHHGTYYAARNVLSSALLIIAAVRAEDWWIT